MPDDPLDDILSELRHELGNTLMVLDICIRLRRNAAQLTQHVAQMLTELQQHIEHALPSLPSAEGDGDE